MLFRRDVLDGIAAGRVTLAFRRWRKPTVRAGGTLRTAIGVLRIESVEPVDGARLTEEDARRAGATSLAALQQENASRDGELYRIALRRIGDDPRIALRETATISADERSALDATLARYDATSRHGAWTARVLEVIAARPGVPAGRLASALKLERDWLKLQVRKLKELGLTESLELGYRLSPRGIAYAGGRGEESRWSVHTA